MPKSNEAFHAIGFGFDIYSMKFLVVKQLLTAWDHSTLAIASDVSKEIIFGPLYHSHIGIVLASSVINKNKYILNMIFKRYYNFTEVIFRGCKLVNCALH